MYMQGMHCSSMAFHSHAVTYLDISQPVLPLPVPNREDVVVGVVYSTQCVSSVLTDRKRYKTHVHRPNETV